MSNKQEDKFKSVERFRIVCDNCNRPWCNFQFTELGDLVVYCRACGQAKVIFKDLRYSDENSRKMIE